MLRFYGTAFVVCVVNVERAKALVAFSRTDDGRGRTELRSTLEELIKECEAHHARFCPRVVSEAKRLIKQVDNEVLEHSHLTVLVNAFQQNVYDELTNWLFFAVPPERKWLYMKPEGWFGREIVTAFPEAEADLFDAARCCALAQWTACVFHLMRGLELALHKWARELGLSQFNAIELENWKNILDAAEKRIKELEQQPKGAAKDAELQYYGETLGHFRAVKDAWRNRTSHARATYDERQALSVMHHVRDFMVLLAARA